MKDLFDGLKNLRIIITGCGDEADGPFIYSEDAVIHQQVVPWNINDELHNRCPG